MKTIPILASLIAFFAIYWVAPAHVIFRVRCAVATFFSAPSIVFANMDLGSFVNPNLSALERTSGQLFFKPTGASSYDDFGPIEMHKASMNAQTEDTYFAINGSSVLGAKENTRIAPVISFEGKSFSDIIEAYLNFGTVNADVTQASASGSTATITAALGKAFDIGARNITVTTVAVSAVNKTADVDFFLDATAGIIRFPTVAAGITAGATVVVTFDKPAITRKSFTGGTALNFTGSLLYIEKDNKSNVPRAEWSFPSVTIAPKDPGDSGSADSLKNKKWSMEAAVSGQWTKLKRAA